MAQHTHDEIRAAIAEIARSELRLEGPLPEGDLSEHLDSVQRLTLVVALEDRFEVSFLEEDDETVRTVDDVVRVILRRLEEAGE